MQKKPFSNGGLDRTSFTNVIIPCMIKKYKLLHPVFIFDLINMLRGITSLIQKLFSLLVYIVDLILKGCVYTYIYIHTNIHYNIDVDVNNYIYIYIY